MFLLLLFLPLISCINKFMCVCVCLCVCVFAVQELGLSPVQCFPTTTYDLNEIATLFAACAMKISLAQPSAEMWQKRWCLSIRHCKTENYLGDACIPKHTQKNVYSVIWSRCPKETFASRNKVEVAALLSVDEYNMGSTASQTC